MMVHGLVVLAMMLLPIQILSQVPCEPCLDVRVVVELTSADAPVVPSLYQSVLRTTRGHYVVSHVFAEPPLVVYDSTGAFLRVYDRQGEGPGEFSFSPRLFSGPSGDIFASEQGRLHRFDADLTHRTTRQLDRRIYNSAAILAGGRVVVDHLGSESQGIPETVTILDSTGAIESTVETVPGEILRRRIGPARTGGFWTLAVNDTELRRYGPDGTLEHTVRIEGTVVEPWTGGLLDGEGRRVPYRPRYETFIDLGGGDLLLVAWVSPADWEPAPEEDPDAGGARVLAEIDGNEMYDSVLEWVDETSGQVSATARLPYALSRVEGSEGLVHSRHPDSRSGHVVTRIWQVSLERR